MAGRLALIVGSQCKSLPKLSFVKAYACDLHQELTNAGWESVGTGDGPLLNPSIAKLKETIKSAIDVANKAKATLLFAFIGHGEAHGDQNFYLMAMDSPTGCPDSENALHLPQFVNERLNYCPSLDGVVFLVDACQAKASIEGAANRWTGVLAANRGRMELLVASGAGSAYDGCFTKTILSTFRAGRDNAGENLLCAELQPFISATCRRSQTQYLAYSGGKLASGDPGLWLVPNRARIRDCVFGRPAAGLVDQLLADVIATVSIAKNCEVIEEAGFSKRLRLVVGGAGCGKSTLLALFVRPKVAKRFGLKFDVAENYIKGAVFLDSTSTVETLAAELASQFQVTVPEFAGATAAVAADLSPDDCKKLGAWDTSVLLPLARCIESGRIHVIVDGLDQPEPGAREVILAALQHLTHTATIEELGHVRVIAGVRGGEGIDTRDELAHAHRVDVLAPALSEIARAATTELQAALLEADPAAPVGHPAAGGWLIPRLLRESADKIRNSTGFGNLTELVTARIELALHGDTTGTAGKLLSLIAAAGVGPVLPIRLLAAALGDPGTPARLGLVRDDVVTRFGALISRGQPGIDQETLGIAHLALLEPIVDYLNSHQHGIAEAHRELIEAYQRCSQTAGRSDAEEARDDVDAYWRAAAPRHYLGSADSSGAIAFLRSLNTPRAADNRDRWAGWLPALTSAVGADNPDTLITRQNLARWRGEAGDVAGAVADYQMLLADEVRVLDGDDHALLITRGSLAFWRGEAGDVAGAVAEYRMLLADHLRVLGHDHPDTLRARLNLAAWRGEAGDAAGALAELELLLPDVLRVLGVDHPDTLITRLNLAAWRGEAGDAAGALAELELLLPDVLRVLGVDHPDTLITRRNLGRWRGDSGDAAGALAEFEALLPDVLRVLGADHPDTLRTRRNLARWRGEAGDAAGALAELETLLPDALRVLVGDHPETLRVHRYIGFWRGEAGDAAGALAELEALLPDALRVLGADHPETLRVHRYIGFWRGEAGDAAGALAELEALLPDVLRVLGADHPDTLITRRNLALWRGEAGDAAGALADLEALLPDVLRVLGADHPDTLRTRRNLALWRGQSGDAAGALAEFQGLLPDVLRVLGVDHPEALITRRNLGRWRGDSGDAAGALAEFEALLPDELRVLGVDHPEALITRRNLARWRGDSGDAAGALAEFEALLPDELRVLGVDHPEALITRRNLARWRGEAADAAGALADLEALLPDVLRVLGVDHPETLRIRRYLGFWRGDSGDAAGALADLEALLPDVLRVLGVDHPETLRIRRYLGFCRGDSGDAAGALAELETLLPDVLRVLGADHPDTLVSRRNLALWRGQSGDAAGAVAEFQALLPDVLRVLGADHPDTLKTRNLARRSRGECGDAAVDG
ncbi:tetratricopeptide repeat protein [Mycobacterium sp. Aquia_213]|uniref:tetratricopeptide repeat protein n=1 Tax=Mycobacterium sp. Aquia_213 TaxID=2991728 RepID=UPI00226D6821|nr:tetratricopeptide repeat protein [Mycobacterium sp. Aquia_213]WAC92613.1 tetratricopeptide repeat protein [Mycobacterium sp. Aquia_213]